MFEDKVREYRALAGPSGVFCFRWDGKAPFKSSSKDAVQKGIYGIYIFSSIRNGLCVYIGKGGTLKQDGAMKEQDVITRLNNRKRRRKRRRSAEDVYREWLAKYGPMRIEVISTWHAQKAPGFAEADLLQAHLETKGTLPAENSSL